MPVFNSQNTLAESINSVLSQTYENWELIIIDDGSTDDSCLIISQYCDKRIQYVFQTNKGVACARNTGFINAKGYYVAFLDSDDIWDCEKLYNSVMFLQLHNCDMIYTKYRIFESNISESTSYSYSEPICENDSYLRLLIYDYIPTLTVVLKRDVVISVGEFDINLHGTEDWDYWIRVSKCFNIKFLTQELSFYRYVETGLSKNRDKHLKEEYKVLLKHVINNIDVPREVIKKSLWVWNKKRFYNYLNKRKFVLAFLCYIKLYYLMPFSYNNIKLLFFRKNV